MINLTKRFLGFDRIKNKCKFCKSTIYSYKFYDTKTKYERIINLYDKIFNVTNEYTCKCWAIINFNENGIKVKEKLGNHITYYVNDIPIEINLKRIIINRKLKDKHIYRLALNFIKNLNADARFYFDLIGDEICEFEIINNLYYFTRSNKNKFKDFCRLIYNIGLYNENF